MKKILFFIYLIMLSVASCYALELPAKITCNTETLKCVIPPNKIGLHFAYASRMTDVSGKVTFSLEAVLAYAKSYAKLSNTKDKVQQIVTAKYLGGPGYINSVTIKSSPVADIAADSDFLHPTNNWRDLDLTGLMICTGTQPCPLIQQ